MANFHKYSLLGLGACRFLPVSSLEDALDVEAPSSPGSGGSICVVSVGSVGLTGCDANGARGAAPLLRDLLLRFRNSRGPSGPGLDVDCVASVGTDVEVDG